MMRVDGFTQRIVLVVSMAAGLSLTPSAHSAIDLSIGDVEINQSVQYGPTTLIGGNVTYFRVTVNAEGTSEPVSGVDGILQINVNGQPLQAAPLFSINGPIVVSSGAEDLDPDSTLNFVAVVPYEDDVDVTVTINPQQSVEETDDSNNSYVVNNLHFKCREMLDIAYVPVDYAPSGGTPDPELIKPGVGDAFVRAIFSVSEWDYHRAPMPPLVWTQDVDQTSSELLLALQDIRVTTLPKAGYSKPEFIYGWLPGNPYSGNGRAIGIPGDVAFGNTELVRFQRTFAHELGHLLGQTHNNLTIDTVGIDTEHHLHETESLDQFFGPWKWDIMRAGALTEDAFVHSQTYEAVLTDIRTLCIGGISGELPAEPVLRICGVINHATGHIELHPILFIEEGTPTQSVANGDIVIQGTDEAGANLFSVALRTDATRASCAESNGLMHLHQRSPFYALVPAQADPSALASLKVVDASSGNLMSNVHQSPSAPRLGDVTIEVLRGDVWTAPDHLTITSADRVRLTWQATDADGDGLTYHVRYSRDGGMSWQPVAVSLREPSCEFDAGHLAASEGAIGVFDVMASDGLRWASGQSDLVVMATGNAPDVHLMTPDDASTHLQHASIPLHAAAWDKEDEFILNDSIVWTSNLDGEIGTGRLLTTATLSPGKHEVTVAATDSDDQTATSTITVTIIARTIIDADLTGDGTVGPADLAQVLGHWGEGLSPADVTFDGTVGPADLAFVLGSWGSDD